MLATDAEVVVAPTRDGGAGGLLRLAAAASAGDVRHGLRSAVGRHLAAGRVAGARAARLEVADFAHDVDVEGYLGRSRDDPALPPLGLRTATLQGDAGFGATA